jgi:hypothetical protein
MTKSHGGCCGAAVSRGFRRQQEDLATTILMVPKATTDLLLCRKLSSQLSDESIESSGLSALITVFDKSFPHSLSSGVNLGGAAALKRVQSCSSLGSIFASTLSAAQAPGKT